jgi:AraC-like DNA-binding protein
MAMPDDSQSVRDANPPGGPPERLAYVRPAAVSGSEILAAYDSFHPWRVFHERYAICACRTAAVGWLYRGRSHYLEDGGCMLLEPGEFHANTRVHKYSDFKVLFIEPDILVSAARELDVSGEPHYRLAQSDSPALFRAVYDFSAAVEQGATALEQQSRFTTCLRQLLGLAERAPREEKVGNEPGAVARAKAYLHTHFHAPITLNDLVDVAGLSRFHLLRTFARYVGLPPHAYQIHLRVERALRLLRTGMPPSLVASAVGFADQSHLTRHMRRVAHVTPARYARARR